MPTEKIRAYAKSLEATAFWKANLCVKIMKTWNNQESVHHVSHDWTIFTVNKWNKSKTCRTNQVFKIFHDLTCKCENLIYLLQCRVCKLQQVRKSETTFNIRLKNHRKNANSEKSILACKNFNKPNHNFHHHAEFTLIEQIRKETEETIKPLKKEKKTLDFKTTNFLPW